VLLFAALMIKLTSFFFSLCCFFRETAFARTVYQEESLIRNNACAQFEFLKIPGSFKIY
jgi:hypothetical protein